MESEADLPQLRGRLAAIMTWRNWLAPAWSRRKVRAIMTTHFIDKCRMCQRVIRQCRCPSSGKLIRWGLCDTCETNAAVAGPLPVGIQPLLDPWPALRTALRAAAVSCLEGPAGKRWRIIGGPADGVTFSEEERQSAMDSATNFVALIHRKLTELGR
jgi:hypothetical protein